MAGKPYKSKLIKYENFIRESRQNGLSYKIIVSELERIYGVKTGHNTVFSFVKVRSKKRKVITMLEEEKIKGLKNSFMHSVTKSKTGKNIKQPEQECRPKKKFHFNPDEPIY
jgi:hypothetical protein